MRDEQWKVLPIKNEHRRKELKSSFVWEYPKPSATSMVALAPSASKQLTAGQEAESSLLLTKV
jgi:hypothetical protein